MANILVVVDHPLIGIDLWDMLQNEGHEVRHVTCGQAGFAAMERQAPDIVVTDRTMPGQDGRSFVDILRLDGRWMSIPIITISSAAVSNDVGLPLAAGFIRKPWSQIALVNSVARLVGGAAGDPDFCPAV